MKQLAIFCINCYILLLSPLLKIFMGTDKMCRYEITCSAYLKAQIKKYGMIRGGKKGLTRLLTCHPFAQYVTHF